mmetsp:Transcript_35951/g.101165  ORF Transcript_35951/g.101165 Transcript_35951/m.101165 type:complete len:213 (-) Transcript_35951:196-834(-)
MCRRGSQPTGLSVTSKGLRVYVLTTHGRMLMEHSVRYMLSKGRPASSSIDMYSTRLLRPLFLRPPARRLAAGLLNPTRGPWPPPLGRPLAGRFVRYFFQCSPHALHRRFPASSLRQKGVCSMPQLVQAISGSRAFRGTGGPAVAACPSSGVRGGGDSPSPENCSAVWSDGLPRDAEACLLGPRAGPRYMRGPFHPASLTMRGRFFPSARWSS